MKNKIEIGVIVFFIIILGYCVKSNATISTQSKDVKSGEQFTVSVTSDVALGAYSVRADANSALNFITSTGGTAGNGTTSISNALSSGGTRNLATFTFKAPNVTNDTTYTIKFSATGMGNENLQPVPDSNVISTITVKATTTNETSVDNTTASKSIEARLSKLGIIPKEYDFSGFSKNPDKENWNVGEVPNSVTEIEVYAEAKSDKAKITGTGKVALKEGNNTIKVTVTAEAGNTKTYSLAIKRRTEEEENAQSQKKSDATLKSLGIKPDKYDFSGFKKDKTQYSVQVPDDVEEVEVYAEATSDKAKITGIGKTQLKKGKNTLVVQVTAEDGTTQTYTIEVTREDTSTTATNNSKDGFGLASLEINGLTLNPSFETEIYEYKVELTEDLDSLDIRTIATDDDTTVELYGNEGLVLGENTITILVRNKKGDKSATYQIIVNKNLSEDEKVSWLKPSTWGKEEIIKTIIIVALIILIVIAIILKIKIAKEKNEEEDIEFPGGEELDKALAEHQELSETAEMQMNLELKNKENFEKEDDSSLRKKGKHF